MDEKLATYVLNLAQKLKIWSILICSTVTSENRNLRKWGEDINLKRPKLDVQASVLDHPVIKRKLVTRSSVLESRGGGRDGGRTGKDTTETTTETFTVE